MRKVPTAKEGKRSAGLLAAATLLAGLAVTPVVAADWFFGAKAGPMLVAGNGVGDPTNAGVMIGREWGVVLGDIGVQGEITTSIDKGKSGGQDVSVDTQAIYGVFRTAGALYLIAKAGLSREELKNGAASASDTGSSLGLGVGFSIGLAQFEVEYTQIKKDIDFLNVGIRF